MLGVIYALPNLYGEDPAVQISLKNGAALDPVDLSSKLVAAIKDSAMSAYKSIDQESIYCLGKVCKSTDLQIEAQDVIRGSL